MTGAGKSTLARGACARLRAVGHRPALAPDAGVYRHHHLLRAYKLLMVARYGALRPARARAVTRAAQRLRLPEHPGWRRLLFNWLYVNAATARAWGREELRILDQGIGQGLHSLALQAGRVDGAVLRTVLAASERPDLVVLVEAPSEVVAARMRERSDHRTATERRLLAEPELMARSAELLQAIAAALEEQQVPVQRCDSYALAAELAADLVAAAIRRRLEGG
jgi:thymidylate kinase